MYSELSKSENITRQNLWERNKYLEKNIGLGVLTKKEMFLKWLWFIPGSQEQESKGLEKIIVRDQGEKQNNRGFHQTKFWFPSPKFHIQLFL